MSDRKTVCVDLDGTIAQYNGWKGIEIIGDPIPCAQEMMVRIAEKYRVVIFTTRTNFKLNHEDAKIPRLGGQTDEDYVEYCIGAFVLIIKNWLEKHDIPYDEIYTGQGKPIAEYYIDDRAIRCDVQRNGAAYEEVMGRLGV